MSTSAIPFVLQRPDFDAITYVGMLLIVALMSVAWLGIIGRRIKPSLWGYIALVFVILANVMGDQLGVFSRLDLQPPPFVILVLLCLGLVTVVGMGYVGTLGDALVRSVRMEGLVALQIFRLPLELLMLRAAYMGMMPIEFSMLRYNWDVLTGLGALLIWLYCAYTRSLPVRAIWIWNVFGIGCLLVIGTLAAMTSPTLHVFGIEQKHINSWVLYFPYSLLPTVLVSYAVLGHVLITRKLLARQHDVELISECTGSVQPHDFR